jgi:hypothetical protein
VVEDEGVVGELFGLSIVNCPTPKGFS